MTLAIPMIMSIVMESHSEKNSFLLIKPESNIYMKWRFYSLIINNNNNHMDNLKKRKEKKYSSINCVNDNNNYNIIFKSNVISIAQKE